MGGRKQIPAKVLEQARKLAEGSARPPEKGERKNPVREKIVASLKRLHPMD